MGDLSCELVKRTAPGVRRAGHQASRSIREGPSRADVDTACRKLQTDAVSSKQRESRAEFDLYAPDEGLTTLCV